MRLRWFTDAMFMIWWKMKKIIEIEKIYFHILNFAIYFIKLHVIPEKFKWFTFCISYYRIQHQLLTEPNVLWLLVLAVYWQAMLEWKVLFGLLRHGFTIYLTKFGRKCRRKIVIIIVIFRLLQVVKQKLWVKYLDSLLDCMVSSCSPKHPGKLI